MRNGRGLILLLAILVLIAIACQPFADSAMAKSPTPTVRRVTATPSPTPEPSITGDMSTISGIVYDQSGNGVPNAKVTLYYAYYSENSYKPKGIVVTANDNPQTTSDVDSAAVGFYVFTGLTPGRYIIIAEKGGNSVSKDATTNGGTYTENLVFPHYVDLPVSGTPQPTGLPGNATPIPTFRPSPVAGWLPGISDVFSVLRVLLMVAIVAQFMLAIAIMALRIGK